MWATTATAPPKASRFATADDSMVWLGEDDGAHPFSFASAFLEKVFCPAWRSRSQRLIGG